jgi:hypothetical protein
MEIPLSHFEIEVLNKVIPTQTLSNPEHLQFALRDLVEAEREEIITRGIAGQYEFKVLQTQTAKNIFQFLRANEFFYEGAGGVFFLTEKIKHLRQQGTIEKYSEWEASDMKKNETVLHTIETRGYLNRDQDPEEHKDNNWKKLDTLDYPVLDEDNPNAHHVHHKSYQFKSKPGETSGAIDDRKKMLYLVIVAVIVIALLVVARGYK